MHPILDLRHRPAGALVGLALVAVALLVLPFVLTGIGTVKDDNPRLTVREVPTTRQPLRVVIDSRLETPLDAAVREAIDAYVGKRSAEIGCDAP